MKRLLILKTAVEHFKIPFALSLSKGGRDFGMLNKWAKAWKPLMLQLFDKLTAQHERFPRASTLIGLLLFATLFFASGCGISPKQPALHDFGLPVSISTDKARSTVTVDAPSWLWDDRIRYRQLYASSTRVGFYALDLWIAPPPELFEQLLIEGGKTRNYSLVIRLQDFEQPFDAPDRARVMLRFSVDAYSGDNHKKVGTQAFYLERPVATPDAAGAVNGFALLARQAVDGIQNWLAGLPGQ